MTIEEKKEIQKQALQDRYNVIAARGKKSAGVLRKIARQIRNFS